MEVENRAESVDTEPMEDALALGWQAEATFERLDAKKTLPESDCTANGGDERMRRFAHSRSIWCMNDGRIIEVTAAVSMEWKGRLLSTLVGCNRVAGCLDWSGDCGYIAFGAHHFVAIYDAESACVLGVLNGHKGQVNCVKWIETSDTGSSFFSGRIFTQGSVLDHIGDAYLISGSADATLRVWRWNGDYGEQLASLHVPLSFHPICFLGTCGCVQESKSGIAAVAVHGLDKAQSHSSVLIAACSSDPEVKIWKCENSSDMKNWKLFSTVQTGSCIHHSAAFMALPSRPDCLLLALGGTDSIVRLFLGSHYNDFHPVCVLRGHEDWIRGLDFFIVSNTKLLLASASQDRFIRVWSMSTDVPSKHNPLSQLAPSLSFLAGGQRYVVKLEGLLTGHEDWVHSIQFNRCSQHIQLLSASMDRTMIIWEWDAQHQCWQQKESVGDAGCSALGYFTGVFSPNGKFILAHGFTGALHLWQKSSAEEGWIPKPAMTGHYDEVVDMCLAVPKQPDVTEPFAFILSVSKDQTTRISAMLEGRWCEIARPQVHGHNFFAVAYLPNRFPDCITSCSEEKVIRVFSAPTNFHQYLDVNHMMTTVPASYENQKVAYGASIKALALTNTAVYQGEQETAEEAVAEGVIGSYTPGPDFAPNANPACTTGAPLEEHLSQNTLWPEIQKLYGHGDIVYSLAVSPCGKYLASACKAQQEDVAVIFVWDTMTWTPLQQLRGHTLTVTRMEFSPSSSYLLSGSRDRTFCLHKNHNGDFQFLMRKGKAHERIIWDVSWTSDELHVATASRDQSIKVWTVPEAQCILQISFEASVTSLAFQPIVSSAQVNKFILASGLQNGEISVWEIRLSSESGIHERLWATDVHCRHADAVYRLRWKTARSQGQGDNQAHILTSCSADHSIRLFELHKCTQ